ncbi:Na+/H+ antiporter subunit E [Amaricoccus sp.]|uniref:Na+/H+ antiporter subunit E n=1 Tax=Amaricoccus sp. TaxID=1872485 RepID=UPI00260E8EF6|nr:Na+/H+ antiporter subunit E [uncultured Amaricoccus sp.]
MSRVVPHPLMALALIIMWLTLTRFSLGNLILGSAISFVAVSALAAVRPEGGRPRRWLSGVRLLLRVLHDVALSNIAVARLILRGDRAPVRRAGFVEIPLDLRDSAGLAILAIVMTSTPGTAWIDFDYGRRVLLLHVFDLKDPAEWTGIVKNRYESLLIEIFE